MKIDMIEGEYSAGVCNIGPEEIARRRMLGWSGLAAALVLLTILGIADVNRLWRAFIFFPAAVSATGFLQAYFHFCVAFARKGLYNFGPFGRVRTVSDDPSKAADRKRGIQITLYAVFIGAASAIAAVLL